MDWDKLGEKLVEGIQKTNEWAEKKKIELDKQHRETLRRMSDAQVRNSTRKAANDYLRGLAREEAERRGIL